MKSYILSSKEEQIAVIQLGTMDDFIYNVRLAISEHYCCDINETLINLGGGNGVGSHNEWIITTKEDGDKCVRSFSLDEICIYSPTIVKKETESPYSQFLVVMLAVCYEIIKDSDPYDIMWEKGGALLEKFRASEYDVSEKSEYDAICEFFGSKEDNNVVPKITPTAQTKHINKTSARAMITPKMLTIAEHTFTDCYPIVDQLVAILSCTDKELEGYIDFIDGVQVCHTFEFRYLACDFINMLPFDKQ